MGSAAQEMEIKTHKILLAEDDYAITLALQTLLQNNFSCELVIVHNGEEALQAIRQHTFDLILSDWNMPLLTGYELLSYVRSNKTMNDTLFFMLTARADKASVIEAVKAGVNGYIHKPFDRTDLISKLKEILTDSTETSTEEQPPKRKIIDQIVQRLKDDDFSLPPLSDVAEKVTKMVSQNTASVQQIAELIKHDPVITARLVSLSNSASYRGVKKCATLVDAITRIGLKDTSNYIWLFHNNSLFESRDKKLSEILLKLRDHSLASAECARLVAKHLRQKNSDEYFYMGLMHDIGAVLILTIINEIHTDQDTPDEHALNQACSTLRGQFSAALLKRWKMPEELQIVAQYHDDLSALAEPTTPILVANFSNIYVEQLGYSPHWSESQQIDINTLDSAVKLNLDNNFLAELEPQISNYMKEIHKMM